MKRDLKGLIFNKYYNLLILKINSAYFTFINLLICYLKGIQYGKKCHFFGKTYFYRYPNSIIKIGNNCCLRSSFRSNFIGINRPCRISTMTENAEILIKNNCGFSGTIIGSFKSISLGNNVRCGANTLITDGDWHYEDIRSNDPQKIVIEDNVWLGEGVKVLKGVNIGANSFIGAGSIVTKNIPANVIAAGNPCKVIKSYD